MAISKQVDVKNVGKLYKKIIYIAPLKTLINQKQDEWKKFENLDIRVDQITGDQNQSLDEIFEHTDIILLTPEKFDSITR